MTFIEFKKLLLDAELTIPKFTALIKVSEKNIQSYKKKEEVPNAIAAVAACFAKMNQEGTDFRTLINDLELQKKEKKGAGFSSKKKEKKEKDESKEETQK
jgi:stringent starvation protein B